MKTEGVGGQKKRTNLVNAVCERPLSLSITNLGQLTISVVEEIKKVSAPTHLYLKKSFQQFLSPHYSLLVFTNSKDMQQSY